MEDRLVGLERRLAQVERRERMARWTALAVVAGAALLSVSRPASTQSEGTTVKAPFKVVDARNRTLLDVDVADGRAVLRVYNGAGKSVVGLADMGGAGGGGIGVYDGVGMPAALVDHSAGGGRLLIFNDAGQKHVGEFSATAKGGQVVVGDSAGAPRVRLYPLPGGEGGAMALYDAGGKALVELEAHDDTGRIHLREAKLGKAHFSRP